MKISEIILLDNPKKFFGLKKKFAEILAYVSVLVLFFSVMNEICIRTGITKFNPITGAAESIFVNFYSIIIFIFLCSILLSLTADKKISYWARFKDMFFVLGYSFTPFLIFGWIPFLVLTFMAIIWSLIFFWTGLKTKFNMEPKKAGMVTILAIVLIILGLAVSYIFYLKKLYEL